MFVLNVLIFFDVSFLEHDIHFQCSGEILSVYGIVCFPYILSVKLVLLFYGKCMYVIRYVLLSVTYRALYNLLMENTC